MPITRLESQLESTVNSTIVCWPLQSSNGHERVSLRSVCQSVGQSSSIRCHCSHRARDASHTSCLCHHSLIGLRRRRSTTEVRRHPPPSLPRFFADEFHSLNRVAPPPPAPLPPPPPPPPAPMPVSLAPSHAHAQCLPSQRSTNHIKRERISIDNRTHVRLMSW